MRNEVRFTADAAPPPEGREGNTFWEFRNEGGTDKEATLYIYGDIVTYDMGDWNFPDDVVPNKFKDELKALGDIDAIHLRINSNGGSVFAAYAVRNLLKSHKARVIAYNDGICASAATIIATAADKVISAVGAMWLYHMPSTLIYGRYKAQDLEKVIKELKAIGDSMIEIYHAKTGMDKKELESFLNEDTLISGTTAMEKGFVDEISDFEAVSYLSEDKKTAFFNGMPFDIAHIRNREDIESLIPIRGRSRGNPAAHGKSAIQNETEETVMDLKELKSKYPDIYNAAKLEGVQEGVAAERERIKNIEDILLPGMDAEAAKAKFESGVSASEFAIAMAKAQKEKGFEYFKNAMDDAQELDETPSVPAPKRGSESDAAEKSALLAEAERIAKSLRGE